MNLYHDAMDHCAPPEGLRERMEEQVLVSRPGKAKTYKPKGFRKKTVVALLAAVLILGTSATTIWDPLFVRRFGPQAALSALGGAVFQQVDVTSVCDDVSLTVTQALCSDKSIYCILEYELPDGFELKENDLRYDEVHYYGTGDYTWEELKALDEEVWNQYDWTDFTSYVEYFRREDYVLAPYDIAFVNKGGTGSGSGSGCVKGYDPETGTLTFMFSFDFDSGWDLTEQPLTILMTPLYIRAEDGTETAVTDHPAIVTFQPVYDGPQARTASLEEGDVSIKATLSPFSLALKVEGMGYPYYEEMVSDTRLVTKDGTEKPVNLIGYTNGGSGIGDAETGRSLEVSTTVHFLLITDTREFTAIRIGDYEVPLS